MGEGMSMRPSLFDLPAGMDLKDVRGHEILVVERDAFEVEYVRVYRVREVEEG